MQYLAEKLHFRILLEVHRLADLEGIYFEAEKKKEKFHAEFSLEETKLVGKRIKEAILTDDRLIKYLTAEYKKYSGKLLERY